MRARISIPRITTTALLIAASVMLLRLAASRLDQGFRRAQVDRSPLDNKLSATSLSGKAAQEYLLETDDGKSLLAAVTAAQFGLKPREQSPFDAESPPGYLGMSHEQNLNAWFAHDGVTVRPTLSTEEREHAWQLGFRLKALGYGSELADAPPIVRQTVEGNRIEYHRPHDRPL